MAKEGSCIWVEIETVHIYEVDTVHTPFELDEHVREIDNEGRHLKIGRAQRKVSGKHVRKS